MIWQTEKGNTVWNDKAVRIINVIASVVFLLLLIMALLPCKRLTIQGSHPFETGAAVNDVPVYEEITLSPGVYLIDLKYETDADAQAFCSVKDGTVITGGLLTNYEHFYSQLGETDFELWLFEKAEHLQVCVTGSGQGELVTGDLTIIQTNRLWTMLMFVWVLFWALAMGITVFHYRDRKGLIRAETKQTIFWLIVITLIASIPYLYGFSVSGADFSYHLHRIEGVKDGLLSGQFPVRLESRWVFDHGYANAIFYCNLFLYFPALLRMIGFPVSLSYNMYAIAMNACTVWIAYYCFKKIFNNFRIGLICCALYTLSVFRIYKFVITSAVGEGSAFTFLPLLIYGFYMAFEKETKKEEYQKVWIPIALGVAGILQSHVLTCEISVLVILLFCLAYVKKVFKPETFLILFKAAMAALLLAAWFVVPFLDYYLTQDMHIKHVSARTIQNSGLELAHLLFHFWTTGRHTPVDGTGLEGSHPVGIGLILVTGAVLFAILWFSGKIKEQKYFKTVFLFGTILMWMSLNSFPWDRIQVLHPILASLVSSLQFPNRFLGWGTACLVTVFGFCMNYFSARDKRICLGLALATVLSVATSGIRLLDFASAGDNRFDLYNTAAMGYGYISGAEYLIEGTDYDQLTFARPKAGESVEIRNYEKRMLGAKISCVNTGSQESYVELPLLLYKGYRAVDVSTKKELDIRAGTNYEVSVAIPAGYDGEMEIRFVSPFYWRIAEVISLLAVLGFGSEIWRSRRRAQ